jgi:hypothetical protein
MTNMITMMMRKIALTTTTTTTALRGTVGVRS